MDLSQLALHFLSTSSLATFAGQTLISESFSRLVIGPAIQKCKEIRSNHFCLALAASYARSNNEEISESEFIKEIQTITENIETAELIHEASRAALLSRSKQIGPTIIGILVGKVLYERTALTEFDESIISISEVLNDKELIEFAKEYLSIHRFTMSAALREGEFVVFSKFSYSEKYRSKISESPGYLPPWLIKLKNLGIVFETLHREANSGGFVTYEEPDITTTIEYEYSISSSYLDLAKTIQQINLKDL